MCESLPGTTHACGHARTRTLVHRCAASFRNGEACPLPALTPEIKDTQCHSCQTALQKTASWERVREALRRQSEAVTGRKRALTRELGRPPVGGEEGMSAARGGRLVDVVEEVRSAGWPVGDPGASGSGDGTLQGEGAVLAEQAGFPGLDVEAFDHLHNE